MAIVICCRVSDGEMIFPSKPVNCVGCGCGLWLANSTLEVLAAHEQASKEELNPFCETCGFKRLSDNNVTLVEPGAYQLEELADYIWSRRSE